MKHRYEILVYEGREGGLKARVDYGEDQRVFVGPRTSESVLLRDVALVISKAEGRPDYTEASKKLF